jgi:hypothetical protein
MKRREGRRTLRSRRGLEDEEKKSTNSIKNNNLKNVRDERTRCNMSEK